MKIDLNVIFVSKNINLKLEKKGLSLGKTVEKKIKNEPNYIKASIRVILEIRRRIISGKEEKQVGILIELTLSEQIFAMFSKLRILLNLMKPIDLLNCSHTFYKNWDNS